MAVWEGATRRSATCAMPYSLIPQCHGSTCNWLICICSSNEARTPQRSFGPSSGCSQTTGLLRKPKTCWKSWTSRRVYQTAIEGEYEPVNDYGCFGTNRQIFVSSLHALSYSCCAAVARLNC